MAELEIHYEEEWAALYVDGRLDRVGDAYLAEERALELCGVKIVHDDAFLKGQEKAAGCAQTLDELYAYVNDRDRKRVMAEQMRTEAANLIAQAKRLEGDV